MGDIYCIPEGKPEEYADSIAGNSNCSAGTLTISDTESTITANLNCKKAYKNYVDRVMQINSLSQDLSTKINTMSQLHREHDEEAGRNNSEN